MKKIIAGFVAMFLLAYSSNAQTQPVKKNVKTVKVSTKKKILLAVQSEKTKAAISKSKDNLRKEGE